MVFLLATAFVGLTACSTVACPVTGGMHTFGAIADTATEESSMNGMAPARDGNIAIREEYDAAIAAGTRDALELFLARHPDHRLAETARRALARLGSSDP